MQYQEINWSEEYNTGVAIVDGAHRQLFSIVKKLIEMSELTDKRRWACEEGIKFFKGYAIRHFAEEEGYMRSINYPRYELHVRIHDTLKQKTLPALEKELAETDYSPEAVQHFLGICVGWLTGHIMSEDRAITGRVSKLHWSENQDVKTITFLEDVVIKSSEEILGAKLTPISEHYTGEGMGESLGYQFVCTSSGAQRFNVTLLFEERFLLSTVGRMLDMTFDRADELVISAARELSNILIHQVGSCFPGLEAYGMTDVRSITEYSLRQQFEDRFPTYSLLFDSGMGHMAMCIDDLSEGIIK